MVEFLTCIDLARARKAVLVDPNTFFGAITQGIGCGEVVEVSGEAGCGKSFLAATVCVQLACAPGVASPACYIGTEDASAQVISTIAESWAASGQSNGHSKDAILSRIQIIRKVPGPASAAPAGSSSRIGKLQELTTIEQVFTLLGDLTNDTAQGSYGSYALYVFDTLASVLRAADQDGKPKPGQAPTSSHGAGSIAKESAAERTRTLLRLGAALQQLAIVKRAAVLVINQAADIVTEDGTLSGLLPAPGACCPRLLAAVSDGRWVRPALGAAWDTCIKTKVLLVNPRGQKSSDAYAASIGSGSATGGPVGLDTEMGAGADEAYPVAEGVADGRRSYGTARRAFVLTSNRLPVRSMVYTIGHAGVTPLGAVKDMS